MCKHWLLALFAGLALAQKGWTQGPEPKFFGVPAVPGTPAPVETAPVPPPPTSGPPEGSEPSEVKSKSLSATGKWLIEQGEQWQATFDREVTAPFEKGMSELYKQYVASLDSTLAAVARGGKLEEAVQIRNERERVALHDVLDKEAGPAEATLQALRASYAKRQEVLAKDRDTKAKAHFARCDAILSQYQLTLTQRQRIDKALEVKSKREQLSALG